MGFCYSGRESGYECEIIQSQKTTEKLNFKKNKHANKTSSWRLMKRHTTKKTIRGKINLTAKEMKVTRKRTVFVSSLLLTTVKQRKVSRLLSSTLNAFLSSKPLRGKKKKSWIIKLQKPTLIKNDAPLVQSFLKVPPRTSASSAAPVERVWLECLAQGQLFKGQRRK